MADDMVLTANVPSRRSCFSRPEVGSIRRLVSVQVLRRLITVAVEQARAAAINWLHVDYEPHLDDFYRGCGFQPTTAGLLRLN
jgi:hypothetical protein